MSDLLAKERQFWKVAATFPPDKEAVYPEHATAHEFDAAAGKRVLEYGCGGGSDAVSFLRRGCDVFSVDIVTENVAMTIVRLRKAAAEGAVGRWWCEQLVQSAMLPFADSSFDVVSSHGVVHHIKDPDPVMAEFERVLKPGGKCYVMLYSEYLFKELAAEMANAVQGGAEIGGEAFGWATDGWGCPWAAPYTVRAGYELFQRAGLVVTRVHSYEQNRFRTFRAEKP